MHRYFLTFFSKIKKEKCFRWSMTFYNGAETKFSEVQSRQKSNAVREKKGKK